MEIIQAICKAILHKLNHESIHNNASHTAPSVLLFLDIDGTLAEFQNNPEHSFIPQQTLTTLGALDARCTLYFVTGRSIAQAESMLPPLHRDHQWNIIGSHGLELKCRHDISAFQPINQQLISALTHYAHSRQCTDQPLRTEIKSCSVALHFRECPDYQDDAETVAQEYCTQFPELHIKPGKCVIELVPEHTDKGQAIEKVLKHFQSQHPDQSKFFYPIFIGDDLTEPYRVCRRLFYLS